MFQGGSTCGSMLVWKTMINRISSILATIRVITINYYYYFYDYEPQPCRGQKSFFHRLHDPSRAATQSPRWRRV